MAGISFVLLSFVLLPCTAFAQNHQPLVRLNASVIHEIDQFVRTIMPCREITGLNLAIVVGNKTLMTRGYGMADLERNISMTDTTLIGIASLTKAFTATLLAKLMSMEKRFTWDTKVRDILGDQFYFSDNLRTCHATLRDLAAHRMGVPSYNMARIQEGLTDSALIRKIRFFEATTEFRGSFLYNNMMYGLLSYVSELIGGKTWDVLLAEYLFQPLGMSSTTLTYSENLPPERHVAKPYVWQNGKPGLAPPALHRHWGKLGGSGAILSNAIDMAQWLKLQVNEGRVDNKQIIEADDILETHKPVNVIPRTAFNKLYERPLSPVSYSQHGYGLGWRTGAYRGWRMVMHTGTSWGYGGLITLLPDLRIAIYTSITGMDRGYHGRRLIHTYIVDRLLGLNPWNDLNTACSFPRKPKTPKPQKPHHQTDIARAELPLSSYEGVYGNVAYGNVTVYLNRTKEKDALMLSYGLLGLWRLRCKTEKSSVFFGDQVGQMVYGMRHVIFNSTGGSVDSLVLPSFERQNPPVFVRGLRMDEAPAPPILHDYCSGTSASEMRISTMLLIAACFVAAM